MATQAKQTVHSGNTILLVINNKVVGRAQGIDARRSFGTEGVYEIGSIMPQEHIYNKYEGEVSLERFFVKKDNLKTLGLASLGEEVLKQDIVDIVVVAKGEDGSIGEVVRAYRGCSIRDYSENFRANTISGENASFVYLKASDTTN
ncbi:hypothetical protein D3C74_50770 [compost metagenome]